MADTCTKTSAPPVSGAMNPKPLSWLKNFTVPVAIPIFHDCPLRWNLPSDVPACNVSLPQTGFLRLQGVPTGQPARSPGAYRLRCAAKRQTHRYFRGINWGERVLAGANNAYLRGTAPLALAEAVMLFRGLETFASAGWDPTLPAVLITMTP